MVGRAVLKHLKASTLLTFFDVLKGWGMIADSDYKYNEMAGTVSFPNGSVVYLRELEHQPSDPEYDRLGSTEFTGAFIDECSQVPTKAKNIVMSRIRYKLEEFGIVPKLLMCSNPTKNFLYYEFYKPNKEGTLEPYRKFIPALAGDNPYITPHYIENLKKLDKVSRERLLYGNFEYDDDPAKLFEYDNIINLFTNQYVLKDGAPRYMSVDVARFGSDMTIIMVWKGLYLEAAFEYSKKNLDFQKNEINRLATQYGIPRTRIVIDEDGVGGGLVDSLSGVKGFVNNSRPFDRDKKRKQIPYVKLINPLTHNYGNLKAQCYYTLSEFVSRDEVGIYPSIPLEMKDKLIVDLEQVKRKDPDKDGKLFVTPKKDITDNIGRSPDYGDALMMRMYFEVSTQTAMSFGNLPIEDFKNRSVPAKTGMVLGTLGRM